MKDKALEITKGGTDDEDPYGVESKAREKGEYDFIHLSVVPKMYFTSVGNTFYQVGNGCTHPLSCMGKTVKREGKWVMPFSIYINHGFIDGSHLSQLIGNIEDILNKI